MGSCEFSRYLVPLNSRITSRSLGTYIGRFTTLNSDITYCFSAVYIEFSQFNLRYRRIIDKRAKCFWHEYFTIFYFRQYFTYT